jgi:hypothetical protein
VKKEMTDSTPPINASGKWCYTPFIKDTRSINDNMFMEAYTKTPPDEWTGTLEGNSEDIYSAVILSTGEWDAAGVVLFDGAVENRKGTLVIWFTGNRLNGEADWSGKWVILLGTDELVNLRGEGTWWGPGAPEVGKKGCVDYSGKIHFGSS